MPTIITIDGPAGSGKSTAARSLAIKLGFIHLNSGGLFRAVGHLAEKNKVPLDDETAVAEIARRTKFSFTLAPNNETIFLVNKQDMSQLLAAEKVGELASKVAILPAVRVALCEVQREIGKEQSLVLEGRDSGTVIFPEANFKFYLDASLAVRAKRRMEQGEEVSSRTIADVVSELQNRDLRDSSRQEAPLRVAKNAVVIDTSALSPEAVVTSMFDKVRG